MKPWAAFFVAAFLITMGLSMLVGHVFTAQGYLVGGLGIVAGVLHFIAERK